MPPSFLGGVQVGSNAVARLRPNVRPVAKLLFARHIQSLLRKFASPQSSSWGDGEFTLVFLADRDTRGAGVPVFLGWKMLKNDSINEAWAAVGTDGSLSQPQTKRVPTHDERASLLRKLEEVVRTSERSANAGTIWKFDVAYRLEGSQILYPHRPIECDGGYIVTLPREPDAETKGWGHNPGVGVLLSVEATDDQDAIAAGWEAQFELVLFWTFLSSSYCRAMKNLFSVKSNWPNSKRQLAALRLPEDQAKAFQSYSRRAAVAVLPKVRRTWKVIKNRKGNDKVRLLTALAAYRTALEIQSRTYHTQSLAVVAYMAALEAILPQPRRCHGQVVCDICGDLPRGHNAESHLSAILGGVRGVLRKTEFQKAEKLLRYAYGSYRSAYVHSARTPLQEHRGSRSSMDLYDSELFWGGYQEFDLLYKLDELTHRVIKHKMTETR